MYKFASALPLLFVSVLVLALTGCDYTPQQGGKVDVRLSSTVDDSDFEKMVTTIEYAAVVPTPIGEYKEDFDQELPNLLGDKVQVDLTSLHGSLDTLLARSQVRFGKYDQIRLIFADSAVVHRSGTDGKTVRSKLGLTNPSSRTVAVQFEKVPLDGGDKRAEIALNLDLQVSSSETAQDGDLQYFEPVVTTKSVTTSQ